MNNAVETAGLRKSYGDNTVLKGIDLKIASGEIFALLGANGAGKTTALECIEGLKKYDGGTVAVKGKVGIQLQSSSLPAHIGAMEAVRLFAEWNGVSPDGETLRSLGIGDLGKRRYAQMSVGQKRRLHLALALIGGPDVVFLDEPTAGLDVEGRLALHEQIRGLKARGKTVVLASHDMAEVEALCDRLAILSGGKIAFCGTPSELTDKIGEKYFIHIKTERGSDTLEAENIEDALLSLLGELKRKGIRLLDISVDRGTLERHFMEIAGSNGSNESNGRNGI